MLGGGKSTGKFRLRHNESDCAQHAATGLSSASQERWRTRRHGPGDCNRLTAQCGAQQDRPNTSSWASRRDRHHSLNSHEPPN